MREFGGDLEKAVDLFSEKLRKQPLKISSGKIIGQATRISARSMPAANMPGQQVLYMQDKNLPFVAYQENEGGHLVDH